MKKQDYEGDEMYVTTPMENLEDISLVSALCLARPILRCLFLFFFYFLFEGAETPRDMLLKDIHCDDKNNSSCAVSASDA